jgi:hypothetical protein
MDAFESRAPAGCSEILKPETQVSYIYLISDKDAIKTLSELRSGRRRINAYRTTLAPDLTRRVLETVPWVYYRETKHMQ